MFKVLHFSLIFYGIVCSIARANPEEDPDGQARKQLKSTTTVKITGKKVKSAIDESRGPQDGEKAFENTGEILQEISKSKALILQPERILGLSGNVVPLTIVNPSARQ